MPKFNARGKYCGLSVESVIETLEGRVLLSSSQLDPNFGTGGEVVTSVAAAPTTVNAVATDASGRIIVAAQEGSNVAVVRYLPTGALDPLFGTGGKAIVALADATVHATAIQTDGKILISGSDGANAFVLRLNTNGKLDTTFGTGGEYFFTIGDTNSADAVGENASGKIFVASSTRAGNYSSYILERLNSNGTEDTTFASHGIATVNIFTNDANDTGEKIAVNTLKVESNGQIVVAGNYTYAQSSGPGIVTFTAAGKVYSQFNSNSEDNIGGQYESAIAIQPNGYILSVGGIGDDGIFLLQRINTVGRWDPAFSGGYVYTKFANAQGSMTRDVIVLPDSKIVVVGYVDNSVEVIRYNSNGTLDTTFGNGGEVSTAFGSGTTSFGESLAYQSSGRIVVAGEVDSGSTSDIGVIRYLGDHVVLTGGQSAVTTGASVAADYRLAGFTVASQILNFSFGSGSSAVHGQLEEQVVKETISGTLDFYYQIINASGSVGGIASLIASNFAGYTTYVDYRPDQSGTIAPVTASRSSDQKSVTFNFLAAPLGNGVVSPGKTSFFLYVKTDATHYNALGKVILNNTASLGGYEPTT